MITSISKTLLLNKLKEIGRMNLIGSNLHKELRACRTKRDKTDTSAITSSLKSALNPFDSAVNGDVPFNIRSGRQASDECASSLLSAMDRGKDA